jgi:hypothetical protein
MRRANVLSLDRARDFRVERPRTRRPNAEVAFTVPAPPDMGNTYQDWRREAVREIKRQGMRSFGGAVRVAVSLPQDRAHGVESCLRAVFDILSTAGVVQSANAIDDYQAKRADLAQLEIRVRAL